MKSNNNSNIETVDDLIIKHHKSRFKQLINILSTNSSTIVVVPPLVNRDGFIINYDGSKVLTQSKKNIVLPISRNQNGIIEDGNKTIIDEEAYSNILTSLGCGRGGYKPGEKKYKNIQELVKRLIYIFPDRVKYDYVGEKVNNTGDNSKITYELSKNVIHLFGASEINWNLSSNQYILGGGQAGCFNIQRQGVFGIVTVVHSKDMDRLKRDLFEEPKTKY
jgi:hypothetical protein